MRNLRGIVQSGLLLAACVVTASAQRFSVGSVQLLANPVLSRNAVGYYRATVARDSFALLSNPFEPLGAPMTPGNVLGSQVPIGTTVYLWDGTALKYNLEALSSNKASGVTWSPNTNILKRGSAFWLKIPASAPASSYTMFIMGEVPDSYTAPNTTLGIKIGPNLIGYPYPVDRVWSNVELSKIASIGDTLYSFGTSGYQINGLSYNKGSGLAWTFPTQVVETGRGYWFMRNTPSALSWTEIKPYTWP
jgi:hypothetical protein